MLKHVLCHLLEPFLSFFFVCVGVGGLILYSYFFSLPQCSYDVTKTHDFSFTDSLLLYSDVIMSAMVSQTISVSSVCSTVCSEADQRKHQSSASLAFVRGTHRWPTYEIATSLMPYGRVSKSSINKLKFYGLSSTPLKWFESYLHGRKQYVDFDGIHSNTAYIGTGVPQGSILGPLLFIIYMNDIHMASQNFDVILYADDTNLISPLCSFNSSLRIIKESIEHVYDQINSELGNIQEWLNINKLSLNVKKSKFMIFHHYQRNINNITPRLKINSETIEKVSEFNFLGLTIDEHLSWKPHVLKISDKIARTLGIMCRLKNFLPTHVLRILYKSLISSTPTILNFSMGV